MTDFSAIGQRKPLIEGRDKVTGAAIYANDLNLPHMLHARFVTSVYAHALVKSIDVDQALNIPGVVKVLTSSDLPDLAPSSRDRLFLAREKVIFVGQPVAMVLAENDAAAMDGAEAVQVEYEPLQPITSIDDALNKSIPPIWPKGVPSGADDAAAHGADVGTSEVEDDAATNIVSTDILKRGDIEAIWAACDAVVEGTYSTPMVHQSSLETHGVIVQPDSVTGGATVWCSTQDRFGVRQAVAEVLAVNESDVRVIGTVVGGAFGAKFGLYEPLVALAAREAKRPVKLILTRSEELLATTPAPAIQVNARLGATKDGVLRAFEADVFVDGGCYPAHIAGFVGHMLGSYYPLEHFTINMTEVMTNKPSSGAYRAPGAPTAVFVIDTLIEAISRQLSLDSIDVRLKNMAKPGDPRANDRPWPNMGMRQVLETLRNHPAWRDREIARRNGLGVGVAVGGWFGGTEPASAVCGLNRDGLIHVQVGSSDISGTGTGFALMAAEAFGVEPDRIRIINSDTETAPFSGGAGGSKTTYATGSAVVVAAKEARRQALAIAAEEFEAAAEDLEIADGEVRVRGLPSKSIKLSEIASKTMHFGGKYPPVYAHGSTAITDQSPGFSAQLAAVSVDQETGQVQLHRLVAVQDVGRAINPLAIEGQMMGGAMQGVGWALHEQMQFDDQGQLISGSWMDYDVPDFIASAEMIEPVIIEVPSDHGPFGIRGVGEPPVIPTAAAIANAITDATGIRLMKLPMTSFDLWHALQSDS